MARQMLQIPLAKELLQRGDTAAALRATRRGIALLHERGFARTGFGQSQDIWWWHHRALAALGRADDAWAALQEAHRLMLTAVRNLHDEGLRRSYLNKLQVHRGLVPAWRARRIARHTITLPPAAAYVDDRVASYAHKVGPAVVDRLVEEALARFDPTDLQARRRQAARPGEGQPKGGRMRSQRIVRHDRLRHEIGLLRRDPHIHMLPKVAVRPAVEPAFFHRRQVVRHQVVANLVALVDDCPERICRLLPTHAVRIAQTGCEDALRAARGRFQRQRLFLSTVSRGIQHDPERVPARGAGKAVLTARTVASIKQFQVQ